MKRIIPKLNLIPFFLSDLFLVSFSLVFIYRFSYIKITVLASFLSFSPSITYCTIPRPFNQTDIMQYKKYRIVFASWLSTSPKSHILFFLESLDIIWAKDLIKELETVFGPKRIIFGGKVKTGRKKTPFINSWFLKGFHKSNTTYICFINADIILSKSWLKTTVKCFNILNFQQRLLVVSERLNFTMNNDISSLDITKHDFEARLIDNINILNPTPYGIYGMDTFTFKTSDFKDFSFSVIPPFYLGIYLWDIWIAGYFTKNFGSCSLRLSFPVYHINHHVSKPKRKTLFNRQIWKQNGKYTACHTLTTWEIKDNHIITLDRNKTNITYSLE
ncbi:hypothetical protein TRFO_42548 [Tritrichomonas foetus]|uniref:Uncharacterized protein n=1 Tax=Tritrichomonas foetus TaxID=1144522 RepID=A0A1J4KWV0_9EUKA|nr:hypothetical protein TRFO_42548 [Tritrichomonas foetus]|eukprot:OHT15352.1 hypothetical protein TRFO_42548 [Tritrichomonas foetus]